MILNQAVNQFLIHQRASGRSPHTIGAHQRDLGWLLGSLGGDCELDNITAPDLDAFLLSDPVARQADGNPKSKSSVNRTRSSVKSFFGWLQTTGFLHCDPAAGIHISRGGSPPPTYLTDDEVRNLLKTIRAHKGWQVERDLVIVQLFLHTGIRLSELVGLDIADVNLIEKRITIRAKGGQTVTRFLNTKARGALHQYLKDRRKMAFDCPALFVSQRLERITGRQVQRRLSGWIEKAGITKDVHPHSLRHSFACSLYSRTTNLLAVQQALGHRSIQTTLVYARLLDDALETALETL